MAPYIDDSTGRQRRNIPSLSTHFSSGDLTSISPVQKSATELASNSQVDDLGNGKHLEQQEDPEGSITGTSTPSQVPVELLITKAGGKFRQEGDSQSMPGNLDANAESQASSIGYDENFPDSSIPGSQDTTLTECPERLGDELREAYCDTESKQRSEFLPIDALDRIVTEGRVKEEIEKFSKIPSAELDQHVQYVLGASTIPGQTTSRKKIFAILALIDKLEAIWDFVAEGIYDVHLPFEKEKAQSPDGSRKGRLDLSRKSGTDGSTRILIRAFRRWTGSEVTNFERTQWNVHIPIFFLNTKKEPKVRHYPLQESVVLPFIEDDEVKQGGKMGGFADVWRVKLHPSHHNQGTLASGRRENPSFAIKRLRYMDEKAFRKEVQNLKRFSTRDYLHLIKLLGTYEWRHQYYLVFPWADGNLLDFWENHPEPLAPRRDINTALWFSKQCLGLVEGMKMIHTWDTPDVDGQHNMFSFPTHQIHGLHGDLKPENILWFRQYEENGEKSSSSMGHFKISDFGLSHFHGTKSVADIDAKDMGFSPTYRAPERDVKGKVAQSYDVWSLACVLLESVSWYVGGYKEVKTFSDRRVKEDMQFDGGYKQDRFFNFMRASQGVTDETQGRAQICAVEKVSVNQEFEKLYDDHYCSDYLVDFLELIQTNLLRLGPEKRRNCTEIAESLKGFHAKLQKDTKYGTKKMKSPPSRSPTLDSLLMDGKVSPEFEKQIRKSLPRRSTSFDKEVANSSTSIPAVLSSSPSSSHINLVPNTRRDSRPSSPERKANFRLSKELSTVEEGSQSHEELDKHQQSNAGVDALASEGTEQAEKARTLLIQNLSGLNIENGETSHFGPIDEQERHPSATRITQKTPCPVPENTCSEVMSTDCGLDSGFQGHKASEKDSTADRQYKSTAEKQTESDDSRASEPAMNATMLHNADGVSQPSHPTGQTEGEQQDSSKSVPRVVGRDEHLKIPQVEGEERTSSDSTTVFQDTPAVEKEDAHDRRTRDPSQTDSHGGEKMANHTDTTESVMEEERERGRWFKSILKKIPCFNQAA